MSGYVHQTGITEDALFDLLSPSIPTTGDMIPVTGAYVLSSTQDIILSRAVRTSTTVITIYGIQNSRSAQGAAFTDTLTNGTGTNVTALAVSISWGLPPA